MSVYNLGITPPPQGEYGLLESLDFYQEMYNVEQYIIASSNEFQMMQFEAYFAESENKFVSIVRTWITKIKNIFKRIREAIVKAFDRLRNIFRKKAIASSTGSSSSSGGGVSTKKPKAAKPQRDSDSNWPEEKSFDDFDYKTFIEDDMDEIQLLMHDGKYDKVSLDKIRSSWGCEPDEKVSTDKLTDHFFPKEKDIKIDGRYLTYTEVKDMAFRGRTWVESLTKPLNAMEKECTEIANHIMKDMKDDSEDRSTITQALSDNAVMVGWVSSITISYLKQMHKIFDIYMAEIARRKSEENASKGGKELPPKFYEAIEYKDMDDITFYLSVFLDTDRTFDRYDTAIKVVEDAGISIKYDKHDGDSFETDKSKWNDKYLKDQLYKMRHGAFSKEREDHLREVIKHIG